MSASVFDIVQAAIKAAGGDGLCNTHYGCGWRALKCSRFRKQARLSVSDSNPLATPAGAAEVKLTGVLLEMGGLEGGVGRGLRIEVNGEIVEITGLTIEELSAMPMLLYRDVTVTVAA